jgi:hypothetical protein
LTAYSEVDWPGASHRFSLGTTNLDSTSPMTTTTKRSGLHFVLISPEYPPSIGGVSDYAANLAAALEKIGHRVSIITSETGVVLRRSVLAGGGGMRPQLLDWCPACDRTWSTFSTCLKCMGVQAYRPE